MHSFVSGVTSRSAWSALFVVLALPLLAGCVGAAVEGANMTRDKVVVNDNIQAAQAGDAVAQYRVGEAMCCSLDEGEAFYDTPQSVAWLCRSAAQGYGPASLMLGRIYAGDTVSGVRVLRRIANAVAGSSTDLPVSYAWLRRAEAQGDADAGSAAEAVWADIPAAEQARATALATGAEPLACEWSDVIGG